MNLVLENKSTLSNKIILALICLLTAYSVYNIFNYRAISYKPMEKVYFSVDIPVAGIRNDTIYPLR